MSIIRQLARVANRIDSASTGTFLSKGDSTGDFTTVNYTDLSGRPTTLDSAALTSLVDSAYIQARQTGGGSAGLDSAGITALVDSNYVVARSPAAASGFANYEYTATAGQTTFQDSDINGNVMSYTADGIFVFYNGVLIAPTTDYEASDGSSVVLTTGADSGSHVAISKWNIASAGAGGTAALYGDRGIIGAGYDGSNRLNNIDYWDMTTSANASDFGDLNVSVQQVAATSDAIRGLFAGGFDGTTRLNFIDYITIASPGNATDFGDLTTASCMATAGVSDATYGVFGGRYVTTPGASDTTIDYVTIQTTGDASDFGDLTLARYRVAPISNSTYGLFAGGDFSDKRIDYITIATTGNASDFGDLLYPKQSMSSGGFDDTRGIIAGGYSSHFGASVDIIEYVTIATPGNATDFGDLLSATQFCSCTSNGTVVHICGGTSQINTIQQITVQTTGNASDFADLTVAKGQTAGCSGSPS